VKDKVAAMIQEVSAAVVGANHMLSTVKALVSTIQATGKIESVDQIIDLQKAALELLKTTTEQVAEIDRLKGELADAKRQLEAKAALKFNGRYYVMEGSNPMEAFCTECFDISNTRSHLRTNTNPGQLQCGACGAVFTK
jgi:hypothetical protein